MKPVVVVDTPSMVLARNEVSSTKTPGARYSGMGISCGVSPRRTRMKTGDDGPPAEHQPGGTREPGEHRGPGLAAAACRAVRARLPSRATRSGGDQGASGRAA